MENIMIWLVDDDAEDLDLFQDALNRNGYRGETSHIDSGNLLVKMLEQSPPELLPSVIVLDLNMHLKNGYEVMRDIKLNPKFRNIPVIILSGSSDTDEEAKCLEAGCDRYWQKPNALDDYDRMAKHLITLF
jgi:CheY-like chemotaxis protein